VRLSATILTLAISGAAGAAQADDHFAVLERLCLKTGARPDAVIRAADSEGWMPVPPTFASSLPKDVLPKDARLKTDVNRLYIIYVGAQTTRDGSRDQNCNLIATPGDADLLVQADRWAGVKSTAKKRNSGEYAFLDIGGRHVPADQAETVVKSVEEAAPHYRYLAVSADKDVSVSAYVVPEKSAN
jgi:hypothetical protein